MTSPFISRGLGPERRFALLHCHPRNRRAERQIAMCPAAAGRIDSQGKPIMMSLQPSTGAARSSPYNASKAELTRS
jgi:hypothetical protein